MLLDFLIYRSWLFKCGIVPQGVMFIGHHGALHRANTSGVYQPHRVGMNQ